jgi:hypothetical protein
METLMVLAGSRRITLTATEAGYSCFDFGRRIGAAEHAADDVYLAIQSFTGAVLRCRTLAEAGHWLAIVEDATDKAARMA